ncbi:hypothetical protein MASR2M117_06220 [Paludibacter sp.]
MRRLWDAYIDISVYPNPVRNYLFIRSEQPVDKVEVYSVVGDLLYTEHNFNEKINIQELPKGMYFVKIYIGKKSVVKHIINL